MVRCEATNCEETTEDWEGDDWYYISRGTGYEWPFHSFSCMVQTVALRDSVDRDDIILEKASE